MALSKDVIGSYNDYNYTGGMQSFTVPVDGIYKLECYGAQGGNGGLGGYSIGYKKLNKGDVLYICVGGSGQYLQAVDANQMAVGGYNGGGNSGSENYYNYKASGGGATHIATMTGTLKSIGVSNKNKILIVAGGGGGSTGGSNIGGSGGGTTGGNGLRGGQHIQGTGGTQTSAGYTSGNADKVNNDGYVGGFGYGGGSLWANRSVQGGGGGLYGGGASGWDNAAGGGSGYIDGVPSFEYKGTTYSPSTSNGQRSGNGFARITLASKLFPTMYYGDNQVSTMFFGDSEIDNIFYGDLQL